MLHICKIKFNATSERSKQSRPRTRLLFDKFLPRSKHSILQECKQVCKLKTSFKNSLKPNRVTRLLPVRVKMLSPSQREKS